MSIRSRLARLERLVKLMPAEAPADTQRLQHVDAAADALDAMIVAVYPYLSDEESGMVVQAFHASTGAFADWMRGLFAGQCRIVPGLEPAVWRDVLLAFVHQRPSQCGRAPAAWPIRRDVRRIGVNGSCFQAGDRSRDRRRGMTCPCSSARVQPAEQITTRAGPGRT